MPMFDDDSYSPPINDNNGYSLDSLVCPYCFHRNHPVIHLHKILHEDEPDGDERLVLTFSCENEHTWDLTFTFGSGSALMHVDNYHENPRWWEKPRMRFVVLPSKSGA